MRRDRDCRCAEGTDPLRLSGAEEECFTRDHAVIAKEVVQLVRDEIGPVAAFKMVLMVDRLPKTRSGKIFARNHAEDRRRSSWKMPATIDDPAILDGDHCGAAGTWPSAGSGQSRHRLTENPFGQKKTPVTARGRGSVFAWFTGSVLVVLVVVAAV